MAWLVQNKFLWGNVLAIISTIIWAGNFIAAKILAPEYTGLEMSFWRWVVACSVTLPFAVPYLKKDFPIIRKEYKLLLLYGILGCFISNLLLYNAPHTAPAVDMTILMTTSPLIMMVLAWLFFKDRINKIWIMGSAIALIGVFVLVAKGQFAVFRNFSFTVGHFWTLGCSLCFALYSVSMQLFKEKIHVTVFLVTIFCISLIVNSIVCLFWNGTLPVLKNYEHVGALLYIGIGSSFLAYVCWNKAIEYIGAVRAGIMYYLVPVFGALFAVTLIDETINLFQLVGGIMVLGGVITCTLYKNRKL